MSNKGDDDDFHLSIGHSFSEQGVLTRTLLILVIIEKSSVSTIVTMYPIRRGHGTGPLQNTTLVQQCTAPASPSLPA